MPLLDPVLDGADAASERIWLYRITEDTSAGLEYVVTVRFSGGPIVASVADGSRTPGNGESYYSHEAFTDAPTKIIRFEPDPYFRSPARSDSAGTFVFRVPKSEIAFSKRVALSAVFTNRLDAAADFRFSLVSAADDTDDPLKIDLKDVAVPPYKQANVIVLLGERKIDA
ncbi:hypothetical protein Pan97_39290 [Bremerella volcania]|uniref:Uncharacterized protein n=1 Tax=Bremerella volcania TaxID=2527984 RepID=A0A518CCC4_9BACT|nr:hypothetical protein [Bremerella volcania]QDU76872.1 hypothetical protein Pan97_39290 [Bremerella volcania]